MNTFALNLIQETMGNVRMTVFSPLSTGGTDTSVTIDMYTRFPNAKFSIPRPIDGSSFELEGQGGGMSTIANAYNYNFTGAKTGPINMTGNPDCKPTVFGPEIDTELKMPEIIPLDNAPISGLTLPVFAGYPSLSKNCDIKLTSRLGFHNAVMDTHHLKCADPAETSIEALMSRASVFARIPWTQSDVAGATVLTIPLNSVFASYDSKWTTAIPVDLNIALLNLFAHWRANICLEFEAVRTSYHNGRLLATVGYGAPQANVSSLNRNVYLNEVLDFTGQNDKASIMIPYNSANAYLNVYQGQDFYNTIQDFSLGTLLVTVLNPLKAPATVAAGVEILVKMSFSDVQVHEMNPM